MMKDDISMTMSYLYNGSTYIYDDVSQDTYSALLDGKLPARWMSTYDSTTKNGSFSEWMGWYVIHLFYITGWISSKYIPPPILIFSKLCDPKYFLIQMIMNYSI